MNPKILFITSNKHKRMDYSKFMSLYGIKVRFKRVEPTLEEDRAAYDFIIREKSNLFDSQDELITDFNRLIFCRNKSTIQIQDLKNKTQEEFTSILEGYINPDLKDAASSEATWFGFDDVFVLFSTGISYKEASLRDMKVTARHNVLSYFMSKYVKKKEINKHDFSQTNILKPIDFDNSVIEFVHKNPIIKKCLELDNEKTKLFNSLLSNTLGLGTFFRSSNSKRENNYWFPGLNGGVPVVPKKDAIHEITFMVHDLMHHASPDLLFDGNHTEFHRNIYVMHRMIGEAISMVLADYFFVDLLKDAEFEYEYEKRKIYYLFKHIMDELPSSLSLEEKLKECCRLNVMYALTDAPLPAPESLRVPFEEKYKSYFISDYLWTYNNFNHLVDGEKELNIFSSWTRYIDVEKLGVCPVHQFLEKHELTLSKSLITDIDSVFHATWKEFIHPKMSHSNTLDSLLDTTPYNAFRRYMTGQSLLFFKYSHIPNNESLGVSLLKSLEIETPKENLLEIYNHCVDSLAHSHVINKDDAVTYKNVFPIFTPFFVYYDSKKQGISTIKEVVDFVFKNSFYENGLTKL